MKKLLFAPFFLIVLSLTYIQLGQILSSPYNILSLDTSILIYLVILSLEIMFSSFFFVLFASLSDDWRVVSLISLCAGVLSFVFLPLKFAFITFGGVIIFTLLSFSLLNNSLKTYLNFNPNSLFSPQIRNFAKFLTLTFALMFFLSISSVVATKGFEIPDSLVDSALKLAPPQTQDINSQLPQIPPDQLALLKQNPSLLKQYGLDPSQLDALTNPQISTTDLNSTIKSQVKDQVQAMIKPYTGMLPVALSVLFYLTIVSVMSFAFLTLRLFVPLTFTILEKTGYISFAKEQREVKKMVV